MKRLSIFIILLFPVLALARNKMSMVTYFPVPYVAYSQVNVDQQLDIGLTSTCEMNLGCSESGVNLKANQVNLNRGKLDLDGGKGVSGNTMTLGNVNSTDGKISFKNVRIQGGAMESLNAESMKVKKLNLFDKAFPSCKGANSDSNGQMKWEELTLQGATKQELYLTCGELGTSEQCQPTDSRGAIYTERCPAGQTGTITYTWNYSACKYYKLSDCKSDSEASYVWVKQAVGNAGSCSLNCVIACLDTYADPGLDQDYPSVSSLPSTYPANRWSSPTCNAENIGHSCMIKARKDSLFCNCVEYKCQEQ